MDNVRVTITIGERNLYREYGLTDGQVPEGLGEEVQSMVDSILDEQTIF